MRSDLPETCFSVLSGEGSLVILKRGEKGYFPSDLDSGNVDENRKIAEFEHHRRGINPAQVMAMQIGSMCGFDVPGADPQIYFDEARPADSRFPGWNSVLYDPHSAIQENIAGVFHQYQIAGKMCCYIDPTVMPDSMMSAYSGNIILPDMVCGKPLIPVTVKWQECDACELTLEARALSHMEETNAGYQIIAKVQVGPVEYALGERGGKFPSFVTWERTPANDGDGPPNYYWGHYFDSRDDAVRDFRDRAVEKYEMLAQSRKPSIKAQLAAKPVPGDQPTTKPKERGER